ncbi:hypothetical protein [Streptomyces hiroshimensis]|uniref:Uncharacterized protein n=1 Tax=Streptomyces hiroshimensis TaxID=66424 RepID=A0ABQ2Y5T4_9ACTN|nr:hypothetical protein [Streptomyces hiroshimensis]GGX60990.1 hypothetical protein GCM10010324_02000 [Streptomyces hiroshimensis]
MVSDPADPCFDDDATLLLLQWLAEQGVVAVISSGGQQTLQGESQGTEPRGTEPQWRFDALAGPAVATELRQSITVAESSLAQCLRSALLRMREAGLSVDKSPWGPELEPEGGIEGIGMLVLDWLVEEGVGVFLKADGQRRSPGWTFIAEGGPLSGMVRVDGATGERCFLPMVARLHEQGLTVPV